MHAERAEDSAADALGPAATAVRPATSSRHVLAAAAATSGSAASGPAAGGSAAGGAAVVPAAGSTDTDATGAAADTSQRAGGPLCHFCFERYQAADATDVWQGCGRADCGPEHYQRPPECIQPQPAVNRSWWLSCQWGNDKNFLKLIPLSWLLRF